MPKLAAGAVLLVLLIALPVALIGAAGAAREAEARLGEDGERAARVLAEGRFLFAPDALRHVARFIGADVAAIAPDGRVAATTLAPDAAAALAPAAAAARSPAAAAGRAPAAGGALPPGAAAALARSPTTADAERRRTAVAEIDLGGVPVTIAVAEAPRSEGALALVYPGHLLREARRAALLRTGGAAAVALALALGAAAAFGHMGARVRAAEERAREAEKLAALGRLFTGLAHEVKNPLAALRMTAELLNERVRGAGEREAVALVLDEIERLSLFAAKLLTYARGPVVAPRPVAAGEVARQVARILERQLAHVRVELEVIEAPGAPEAMLDAVAFRHVLMNLVLNAADAMPRGGRVRIRIGEGAPGACRVVVEDEGEGVAAADVARLFEPFFTRKPGGTGLGLHVSRTIVAAHGGTIAFEPRARGAAFVVEVPAAPAPCAAGARAEEGATWRAS